MVTASDISCDCFFLGVIDLIMTVPTYLCMAYVIMFFFLQMYSNESLVMHLDASGIGKGLAVSHS